MAMAQQKSQNPLYMSEADYLAFEEQSEIKHEYARGRVYEMAGADWNHVMITQSTSSALYAQLRGKSCKVGTNDLRLKVKSKKVSYRYPDVMVYCGDEDYADERNDTLKNPLVIVEVLSPSTALKDRNEKLDEYLQSTTLQEYVLVTQHEAKVEVFSRHESGKWLYDKYKGLEASLLLASIDCTLDLSRIYRKVTLDDTTPPPSSD